MPITKLISPSDLRAEAQKLLAEGKMPALGTLLKAVAQARQKYGPLLKIARNLPEDGRPLTREEYLAVTLATLIETQPASEKIQ